MPTSLIFADEIAWNPGTGKVEMGLFPDNTGYDEHYPAEEPAYQVLKDFLLLPGVEESDTIQFDENGNISFFCKYGPQSPANSGNYTAAADMEIVIGIGHGTTPGAGQLDPRLFASEVNLAGWPAVGPDANKSIKVSGANLASGSVLILHGSDFIGYTAPYYIYSGKATHKVKFNYNDTYVY
jgi:hypothetical protein